VPHLNPGWIGGGTDARAMSSTHTGWDSGYRHTAAGRHERGSGRNADL
jgi:hypothetical protein